MLIGGRDVRRSGILDRKGTNDDDPSLIYDVSILPPPFFYALRLLLVLAFAHVQVELAVLPMKPILMYISSVSSTLPISASTRPGIPVSNPSFICFQEVSVCLC
jgi:hypothetical protein